MRLRLFGNASSHLVPLFLPLPLGGPVEVILVVCMSSPIYLTECLSVSTVTTDLTLVGLTIARIYFRLRAFHARI